MLREDYFKCYFHVRILRLGLRTSDYIYLILNFRNAIMVNLHGYFQKAHMNEIFMKTLTFNRLDNNYIISFWNRIEWNKCGIQLSQTFGVLRIFCMES